MSADDEGEPGCPVCGGVVPPPIGSTPRVNCSRACTVRAAERRQRGAPVQNADYAKWLKKGRWQRSAAAARAPKGEKGPRLVRIERALKRIEALLLEMKNNPNEQDVTT